MSETHVDNTLVFETTAASIQPGDLFLVQMHGVEALSTPYEFRLTLQCGVDGGLGPDTITELLDASCQIGFGPGGTQRVSGVLRQIELIDMEITGARTVYEAVLVPRLWLATLSRRSRCFNDKSIPDVIKTVLGDMELADGTDFELRLVESYSPREYIVQYEESDFAFLSRWMERLGLFYCFEQTDECEKLVIADSNSALVSAPDHSEVAYSTENTLGQVGAIHQIRRRDRRMPKTIHVRDYNWRTPAKPITGDADVDADHGVGLQTYYGDHFADDAQGATYARLRAETWNATKQVFTAWSVNPDFAPGHRITVSGAPVGELDIEYVITRTVHRAHQLSDASGGGDYRNEIEAIAYAVPYRPARIAPWPRIDGVMHAKIDAEAVSSAAPIDDKGRYKVVFPYDLYGAYGGKSTRWVRKAEPYSGSDYGMHFTLHVGAEVAIAHVNGDPDRPIILGSVPNTATVSPLTSTHATRSAIRTRSGILIDFEDDA